MGKSAIFSLKSSHTEIDWLGSQIIYENWKRLSTYPNPVFISRYIYSAKIIVDVGYVFLLYIFKLESKIEVHKRFLRDIFLRVRVGVKLPWLVSTLLKGLSGVAVAYVRKSGQFLRKIRNCKSYFDIAFVD